MKYGGGITVFSFVLIENMKQEPLLFGGVAFKNVAPTALPLAMNHYILFYVEPAD